MSRPGPEGERRWLRLLAAPQVLIAGLLALAGIAFLVAGGAARVAPAARVSIAPPDDSAKRTDEVRLILVDADGLERPRFVSVSLPGARDARLHAILDALRSAMIGDGGWPQNLPTPGVFVEDVNRRAVAVLDIRSDAPVAVSVGQELQLLRSLRETVLANDVDEVRFLRDGRPARTLLGHVAVDSGL